jgi:hypothetical protein
MAASRFSPYSSMRKPRVVSNRRSAFPISGPSSRIATIAAEVGIPTSNLERVGDMALLHLGITVFHRADWFKMGQPSHILTTELHQRVIAFSFFPNDAISDRRAWRPGAWNWVTPVCRHDKLFSAGRRYRVLRGRSGNPRCHPPRARPADGPVEGTLAPIHKNKERRKL